MRTVAAVEARGGAVSLPEPTAADLLDEIKGLCGALMARDIGSGKGIKGVTTRAWRTGRIRPFVPAPTMRVASLEDLWHDLEVAVVELRATGATRRRLNPILRGLPKPTRTEAQKTVSEGNRDRMVRMHTARKSAAAVGQTGSEGLPTGDEAGGLLPFHADSPEYAVDGTPA